MSTFRHFFNISALWHQPDVIIYGLLEFEGNVKADVCSKRPAGTHQLLSTYANIGQKKTFKFKSLYLNPKPADPWIRTRRLTNNSRPQVTIRTTTSQTKHNQHKHLNPSCAASQRLHEPLLNSFNKTPFCCSKNKAKIHVIIILMLLLRHQQRHSHLHRLYPGWHPCLYRHFRLPLAPVDAK